MSGDKRGGRLKPGGDPWEQRRKNVVKKHLGDKIDRTSWWLVEMWRRTGNQGQLLGALVGSGSTEMGIQEKTVECNVRFLWFHRHKSETGKKWYLTMKNDIQSHRGTLTNLNNGLKSESWSIWIFTGDVSDLFLLDLCFSLYYPRNSWSLAFNTQLSYPLVFLLLSDHYFHLFHYLQ